MKSKYLEITYRKGKVMAAYLYLPREVGERSLRTEKFTEGILIDYGKFDQPIGIEITDPRKIRANIINEILFKKNIKRHLLNLKKIFLWLSPLNELIISWDCAPHHRSISNFAHHKHL